MDHFLGLSWFLHVSALRGNACRVRVTANDFLRTGRIQSIAYSMKPREREREPEDV